MGDKKASDKLLMPPKACISTLSAEPPPELIRCTSSATGNPRNKCALKPGHSLMDWIRLSNSGNDLSGTGGRLVSVSQEELVKHNTRNDAWMAIGGVVYNVTQYIEFHPGGVEELMRGVGSDATKLFNDTHSWVNYSQLLYKCRIGALTTTVKLSSRIQKSLTLPHNNPFVNEPKHVQQADIFPRLDWIQNRDNLTLFFYTKYFCNPGTLIRNYFQADNRIEIWILISLYVHIFNFELHGSIQWPPKNIIISAESGKIEVKVNKQGKDVNLWSDLGKYKMSTTLASALELEKPLEFEILSNDKFSNDSFVMLLQKENVIYCSPVGYHVIIEDFLNGKKVNKSYTPVPKIYAERYVNIKTDTICMYFLIKCYPNANSFSEHLCSLQKDTTIKVSLPKGNLNLSTLSTHRKFCFLAAGSGLTPFLSLIDHLLDRKTNRTEVIKLLYFNKTISDSWCNELLVHISTKDGRFEFINVFSNTDELCTELKGRVSLELLFPIVNSTMENCTYIAACGPLGFINDVENILKDLNFPKENLFIF